MPKSAWRARAPLYSRLLLVFAVVLCACGLSRALAARIAAAVEAVGFGREAKVLLSTATWATLAGRLVVLAVLCRRFVRVLRRSPSSRCRGANGGRPLEPSMEGIHFRFLELYGDPSAVAAHGQSAEAAVLGMQRRVRLADGQEIAYWDVGGTGSPILLCNGLGVRVAGWTAVFDALHSKSPAWRHRRLVIPELRGMFASVPLEGNGISMGQIAEDMTAVAAALGIHRATLLCYSTGVAIGLEIALQFPEFVEGLILIQGTTGELLHSALQPVCALPGMPSLLGAVAQRAPRCLPIAAIRNWAQKSTACLEWSFRCTLWVFGSDLFFPLVLRYGQDMIHTDANFASWCLYVLAMDRQRLYDRIPDIRAPALVISGLADFITPARGSYDIAARLGGETEAFNDFGGSHWLLFEEPHKLAGLVADFLDRHAAPCVGEQ